MNKDVMNVGDAAMAMMGITTMTYIRPTTDGKSQGFAVCAADGTELAVFASYDAAYFTARQYNLTPVNIH
jgi:hypothetical protein